MDTTAIDRDAAAAIERAEMRAWTDLYGAAPAEFAEAAGLDTADTPAYGYFGRLGFRRPNVRTHFARLQP